MTEFNHLSSPNTQSRRIHSSSCFTTPISGSSSPSRNITTIDVYDLAAEIGKDFEYLADKYGRNSIDGIMPKVISALETLELLAKKNSEETDEITELKNSVDILENEKKIRIKERTTLEIELEQSDDHYRKEIDELKEIVKLLQQENKQIKKEFNENCDSEVFNNDLPRESDLEQIMILREEVSSQQKKMTQFRHDNDKLSDENVNLQNCVEKLIRQNQELVRKNESLGSQARVLIQEKNDLNRTNHKIEIKIIELSKRLSEKNRICQDLESLKRNDSKKGDNSDEDAPKFTLRELKEVLQEKNILKARVMELDEYMEDILKKLRAYEEKERLDRANNPSDCINCMTSIPYSYKSGGSKMSIESASFLRDRYHSNESLNSISNEDEWPSHQLNVIGKEETIGPSNIQKLVTGKNNTGHSSIIKAQSNLKKEFNLEGVEEAIEFCDNQISDELLVYGPINKEPDEKSTPWKYDRPKSGIKKFFTFFLDSVSVSSGRGNDEQQETDQQ